MSEGQSAPGRPDEATRSGPETSDSAEVPGPGMTRRPTLDPAAVLLAVERVADDVSALSRALAAQPEAVAARVDVDAATASIGVRVGALGSALDQFRLSLLAALDRTAERLDEPSWLPRLLQALADRTAADAPAWLPDVTAALAELAARPALSGLAIDRRLDDLTTAVARLADDHRLDDLTAAVAAADPDERLARVEQAIAELADGVRAGGAIADALDHLGQRLGAIEDAAVRVADDARALLEQVGPVPDRLSAIASQVDRITPLARAGDQAGSLFDQLRQIVGLLQERRAADELGREQDDAVDQDDADRFEGIVDVLSGVARRQDQLTAAIASVLDQAQGSRGVDAASDETAGAVDSLAAMFEQQERTLASHLSWVGDRLAEVASHLVPNEARAPERIDEERNAAILEELGRVTRRQDELAASLARLVDDQPAADLGAQLADLARRQDELLTAISSSVDEVRGPMATAAVFDRMEQRERSLAARLDRIDLQLRQGSGALPATSLTPAGGLDTGAVDAVATSVDAIAAVTEDLNALVKATAERLERRLAGVEAAIDQATSRAARAEPAGSGGKAQPAGSGGRAQRPPPPSPDTEAAALRLAQLRAERAQVQARLQEERLLAARAWDEE